MAAERISVSNLPFDLMHDIFTLAHSSDIYDNDSFPLIASQVCRQWREYALASHGLWNKILFNVYGKGQANELETIWKWQTLLLERSGNHPLDIVIDSLPPSSIISRSFYNDDDDEDEYGRRRRRHRRRIWGIHPSLFGKHSIATITRILRYILPHSARWRSIEFICYNDRAPNKVVKVFVDGIRGAHVPCLRKFMLYLELEDTRWRGLARHEWPDVQHLRLENVPADYNSPTFSNLLTLHIADPCYQEASSAPRLIRLVKHILFNCPRLVKLYIGSTGYGLLPPPQRWRQIPVPDVPATFNAHEALVKLELPFGAGLICDLLRQVRFPALKTLGDPSMTWDMMEWSFSWDMVAILVGEHTLPRLKSLALILADPPLDGPALLRTMLVKLEGLEELTLRGYPFADVEYLGEAGASLSRLVIQGLTPGSPVMSELALANMVRARMESAQLENLAVLNVQTVTVEPDGAAADWLRSLENFTYYPMPPLVEFWETLAPFGSDESL